MISINQFKVEQKVDIFQLIKSMRAQKARLVDNTVSYSIAVILLLMHLYIRSNLSLFIKDW